MQIAPTDFTIGQVQGEDHVFLMMGVYPAVSTVFFSTLQGSLPNELRGFSIPLCGLTNAVIGARGGPLLSLPVIPL